MFMAQLSENPEKALSEYHVLSCEEMAALTSGDIKKIESWVGKPGQEARDLVVVPSSAIEVVGWR